MRYDEDPSVDVTASKAAGDLTVTGPGLRARTCLSMARDGMAQDVEAAARRDRRETRRHEVDTPPEAGRSRHPGCHSPRLFLKMKRRRPRPGGPRYGRASQQRHTPRRGRTRHGVPPPPLLLIRMEMAGTRPGRPCHGGMDIPPLKAGRPGHRATARDVCRRARAKERAREERRWRGATYPPRRRGGDWPGGRLPACL